MKIEQYFNKKSGIFTALAIFITFMVLSEDKSLFLSFSGFFISFILLSYLLSEAEKLEKFDVWGWLLYLGYNVLFIASLLYGLNRYISLFKEPFLTIMIVIAVGFYGFVSLRTFFKQIKKYL